MKFKPTMKNGMGEQDQISPEAHREWADEEGKHSILPINKMGVSGPAPTVLAKRKGFDPGKNTLYGEKKSVSNSKGDGPGKSPFPSISSGGPKSGPMKGAGKGSSGAIKESVKIKGKMS